MQEGRERRSDGTEWVLRVLASSSSGAVRERTGRGVDEGEVGGSGEARAGHLGLGLGWFCGGEEGRTVGRQGGFEREVAAVEGERVMGGEDDLRSFVVDCC